MQKATKTAKFKSGLVGIVVGVASATSLFTTGCPPQPDKFSVTPLTSPLVVDEGKPVEARFRIVGGTIDDVVTSNANSLDYHQLEFSKVPPNEILVTGLPIDYNKNGPSDLEVELTDLDGKKAYSKLPIEIVDTIDVTFSDLPEKIYATKGLPTSIYVAKVFDDYSKFNGQGLSFEIKSPRYTAEITYFLDGNSFSFRLIPNSLSTDPTYADFIVSDNEGNARTIRVPIEVLGLVNQPPVIGETPDVQTKEGQGGEFSLAIHDDYTPFDELLMYATSDDFHTALQALNGTVKIIYNPKDLNDNGLKKIKFTTIDGDGASSYKDIYVTISPMTDMEFNVLGQNLIIGDLDGADDVVVGHNTVPLANAGVRVYKREINWVEKEEYGDLYHFRMGINSVLGELLYAGTTDSQGNIKFKVDPQKEDEGLLYLIVENIGFYSEDRHYFGDEDIDLKVITLQQENSITEDYNYNIVCNNGFQPTDGDAYIKKANMTWPYFVFSNSPKPTFSVIIKDGEYVSQQVLDLIPTLIEYVFGDGVQIEYDTQMRQPYSNKIFIEFGGPEAGSAFTALKPLSNLMDYAGIEIPRDFTNIVNFKYTSIHELEHARSGVSHTPTNDFDSHYATSRNFSTFPYLTGTDLAVLHDIKERLYPGDKFIFENGKLIKKSFSVIDFSNEKIYYLIYVEK